MPKHDLSLVRVCPLIIVAGLLTTSIGYAGDSASTGIDLSGTWILNEKLSDNPMQVMKDHMGSMRPPGGGPPGGGMGGGPPGGMGGGPPSGGGGFGGPPGGGHGGMGGPEGDEDQMQKRMKSMQPAKQLVIISNNERVTFIPWGQDTLVVVPDGKKHEKKTKSGLTTTTQAEWKDLALEVRISGQNGREAKRLYRINPDGLLEVVTEFEPPMGGEKIKIVLRYDDSEAIK
jgi:hypothetical protein